MAPLDASQVPPPDNWQDFERLCRDLWREIWNDAHTRRHGRQGQPQHGVDVFGQPDGGAAWAGVQCKLKNRLRGEHLTPQEIVEEVGKAEGFNPRLGIFILATTAESDARAQAVARELTEKGPLRVSIASWEDIWQELTRYPELVAKHYPHLADAASGVKATVRADYLTTVWSQLYPTPLLAVGSGDEVVPLSSVYTALDVTAELARGGEAEALRGKAVSGLALGGEKEALERLERAFAVEAEAAAKEASERGSGYRRRARALEAAAVAPRLVLLGPAGSGKSTFARHLALCLAGETLRKRETNLEGLNKLSPEAVREADLEPWPHGALLPIFVELRRFVHHPAFAGTDEGDAEQLLTFLGAGAESSGVGRLLREVLLAPAAAALLVLDGLDETPAAHEHRRRLKQVIQSWTLRFPSCRILVTSRPYAYEPGSAWRLDALGFEEATLAPFDDEKSKRYVEGWYRHLASCGQLSVEQAEAQSAALLHEIRGSEHLRPLAERPLMLSMMTHLHAQSGGRFRGGRAGLYERSVELLLDRWNEVRAVPERKSAAEHLGMEIGKIRKALEELAYEVHRSRGAASGSDASEITAEELWEVLGRYRSPPAEGKVDERYVMGYLHERAGILVGESEKLYRFPHRSYQEYLAACHLLRVDFPNLLLQRVAEDPELWREVLLLAAGKVAATPFTVWALLDRLVPEVATVDEVKPSDPGFVAAFYAALAVRENDLWREVQEQDAGKLERVRRWLELCVTVGALAPGDRASAGQILGLLGDRRSGVGVREGVPDIEWMEIPAGSFVMGSESQEVGWWDGTPRIEVDLPGYRISRYPVTNAQYRAFVEDGGYRETWRKCWTEAGWNWKGDREGPKEQLPAERLLDNHPRVAVCWYEAWAFGRWLGEKLGHQVRLPSEAEWEKAARGTGGRVYPWGEEFEASHCNAYETGIRTTSAVGMFPSGGSPYGVLDMSGNVWEWCSTKWRDSYEVEADEDPEGDARRVARGGSFVNDPLFARCAARDVFVTFVANSILGFRVCAPI